MYLSKLVILGFKSFAQKTVIHFNKGITAIVGPNGCGKTNIVDALRWCIGEQKSSVLRSDKMENVIFNGTSSRKPLGMSEVSLTIENDKGVLLVDYTEVVITRRIFRSGESEYLMNKNIARLKDITSLFMDTGMGANAYSVIETIVYYPEKKSVPFRFIKRFGIIYFFYNESFLKHYCSSHNRTCQRSPSRFIYSANKHPGFFEKYFKSNQQ